VVVAATYIESKFSDFIDKKITNPENFWKGSYINYSQKLRIAVALGMFRNFDENDWSDLPPLFKKFGDFRNKFSHRVSYKVTPEDLQLLKESNSWFSQEAPKYPTSEKDLLPYTSHAMTSLMALAAMWANWD
jgi:hypothetical protein